MFFPQVVRTFRSEVSGRPKGLLYFRADGVSVVSFRWPFRV
jgi:hypothetical protein